MKKVVIDFGIESINIIKIEQRGKEINVISFDTINASKYLNDSGTYDVKQVATDIRAALGKDAGLDIDIILPDYMSKSQYINSEKLDKVKNADVKDQFNGKMNDKQVSFVGDNGTDSISQIIIFNKQILKSFIKEMYKAKLNVVSAISRYSAYQYTMPLFQDSGDTNFKNHLFIQVGTHNVSCIVMMGNLPVYMKESGFNMYELYQNMKEQNPNMRYCEFIQAFCNSKPYNGFDVRNPVAYVSEASTTEEAEYDRRMSEMFNDDTIYEDYDNGKNSESDEIKLDKSISNRVSQEIQTFFEIVCQDAKEVIDYINDQYRTQDIEVCTNSKVACQFINNQLSSIYKINDKNDFSDSISIGDTTIKMSNINNADANIIACLGNVIAGIKKGADFYA